MALAPTLALSLTLSLTLTLSPNQERVESVLPPDLIKLGCDA